MWRWLRPSDAVGAQDVARGIRFMLWDGVCAQTMATLVGGVFVVDFALRLGASDVVIGLLGAIGPLSQVLQIPSIFLIDRVQRRKAIAVLLALASRLVWLAIAALPFLAPPDARVPLFLALFVASAAVGTVSASAWGPWVRDLVPDEAMSGVFARRLTLASLAGAVLSLVAAWLIDEVGGAGALEPYSAIFAIGAVIGIAGALLMLGIPEPRMAPPHPRPLPDVVGAPLRDPGFRQLMRFLAAWTFAAGLTGPFVAVYLLRRLELSVALVVGLGVVTQLVNAGALPLWNRVAGRFGAKPVLALAGAMFLTTFLLWPLAGQLAESRLLLPVLLFAHVLAGVGNAGVTLGTSTIALRAAPRGASTAYLATNALASGVAAALAPAIAGVIAAWSLPRTLALDVRWTAAVPGGERLAFSALELRGLDFLFLAGWLAGLYAMHRLLAVEEGAPVGREEVASALVSEVRRAVIAVPGGAALTRAVGFPLRRLAYLFPERRAPRDPPRAA